MQQSYENRELRRENQKLKEQLRDVTLLSDTDTLIAPVPRSQALYLGIPTSPAAYVGSLGGSEIQPSEIYIPSDENFHSRLAPSEPVSPSGASPRQEILPSIHNISLASLAGARDDFTKQRPDWPLLLHDPTNWSGRRTTLRSIFSNATLKATMLPRLEGQPPRSGQGCSQEHLYEQVLERVATEPTSIEAHHDYTTTADSGYHSGTRNSCTNLGEGDQTTMTPTVWSQMAGHPLYPGRTNTCWRPNSLARYSTALAQELANNLSNEGRQSRTCCTVSL
jgi:hypothetical protein